jgi:hypothetical protein
VGSFQKNSCEIRGEIAKLRLPSIWLFENEFVARHNTSYPPDRMSAMICVQKLKSPPRRLAIIACKFARLSLEGLFGWDHMIRIVWTFLGLLLSIGVAHADKLVASGRPLMLYEANATNPDCTSAGAVVLRLAQPPEHGRVSIRRTGVFPRFAESNLRSVCNRRRVPGVQATYVSQRGYLGPDFVILEALFPRGQGVRVRLPIRVM